MSSRRNWRVEIRLNYKEFEQLKRKSQRIGLSKSTLIRCLIAGYEPKEKPDEKFYDILNELRYIGHNINQIIKNSHHLGFVDKSPYTRQVDKLNDILDNLVNEYLMPKKIGTRYYKELKD